MAVRTDFLETRPAAPTQQDINMQETNRLLKALLAETRKQVPKLRCVVEVTEGVVVNGFAAASLNAPVKVQFLNEGNIVKSFYTIVINGGSDFISVTINEPNVTRTAGVRLGNGYVLASPLTTQTPFMLVLPDVEIQMLSISANVPIPVQYGDPTTTAGMVMIYGWTLQEYANITE